MSRHPVVLTSLEEDFKRLGLLSEDNSDAAPQHKPAPKGDPSTNSATKSRNVGDLSDNPSNKGGDEHDAPSGIPHAGKPKSKTNPAGPEPKPMKAEAKDDEDEDEEDDDKKKDEEDEEANESIAGSVAVSGVISRLRGGAPVVESNREKVAALIASVNDIMESIDGSRRSESVKAFANVSIIAEMLRQGYATYAESYEDSELGEAAEALGLMSEEAAEIARALESGEDLDGDAVEEEFRNQMDALLSGLDLYSDIVESDDSEESEESEESETVAEESDDDDKDDKDDEDDEDEKSDDEDDEKKDKKPDFFKKKEEGKGPRFGTANIKGSKPMQAASGAGAAISKPRLNMSKNEAYLPFGKKPAKK